MLWCLAEAIRDEQRRFVRKCSVLAVKQDARKHYELSRFSGSTKSLETMTGMLWVQRTASNAPGIVKAVLESIVNFCTPRIGAPYAPATHNAKTDAELVSIITSHTEITTSDKASVEMRVNRMLRGRTPVFDDATPVFDNVKCHIPDVTHASVRIIKKPWGADPYLKTLLDALIWGCSSIVSTIQHSDFHMQFQAMAKEMEGSEFSSVSIRDLNLAKHRFNSVKTPIGRFVLFLTVVWALGQSMLNRGAKDPARISAQLFFDTIDEEAAAQVAMLADFADEHGAVVRFLDTEDYDAAELPYHLCIFLRKLHFLFVAEPPGCMTCTTYTSYMVKQLEKPLVATMPGGTVKQLGGHGRVTDAIMTRCRSRMANCIKLAAASMDAEFPSWKLIHAFRVFDLSRHDTDEDPSKDPARTQDVERLAQVWDVDTNCLANEMADFKPMALQCYKDHKEKDSSAAWASAIRKWTQKQLPTRKMHPASNLGVVVQRLACFRGITTSGVEQSFASMKELEGGARQKSNEHVFNAEMKLAIDKDFLDSDVIKGAGVIWDEVYPSARKSGSARDVRIDRGSKRPSKDHGNIIFTSLYRKLEIILYTSHTNQSTLVLALSLQYCQEGTEKHWLQQRRASVDAGVSSASVPAHGIAADAARMGMDEWTDGQTRLQDDLEALQTQAKVEAAEDGSLLPREMTAELRDGVHQMLARRKDADRDATAADRRAARIAVGRRGCIKLSGRKVFIGVGTGDHMHARAREVGLTVVSHVTEASVFVSNSIDDPGQHVRMAAHLVGGTIVAPSFIDSDGDSGASISFKAALSTKRRLWLSLFVCRSKPALGTIIMKAVTSTVSKWTFIEQEEYIGKGTHWEYIAIVTEEEKASAELTNRKTAMTLAEFVRWSGTPLPHLSTLGACRI